jgi:hypothetical protein
MLKVLDGDVTAVHELGQYFTCLLLRVTLLRVILRRVPKRPKDCLGFQRVEFNSIPWLAAFLELLLALLLRRLLHILLVPICLFRLLPCADGGLSLDLGDAAVEGPGD